MASQVADHADNQESRLDQTRNVFDIGIILNRRKEKSQVIYYCITNRLTLFLFTAGARFFASQLRQEIQERQLQEAHVNR
jgi:adenosyl cobinamide kinase/adenosyl cobinamide phosphate guanylyltransferase